MTDQERLDEALARAAEEIETLSHQPHLTKLHAYLAGWAEVVRLLSCWHQELYERENDGASLGYPGLMHEELCSSTTKCDPCKPCQARIKFCDAMLGEEE